MTTNANPHQPNTSAPANEASASPASPPLHTPVLLKPVLEGLLAGRSAAELHKRLWVDGTLGQAGHASALLKALAEQGIQQGTLLGIDQDASALALAQQRLQAEGWLEEKSPTVHLEQSNFVELPKVLAKHQLGLITGGLLLDLGVSSMQLDQAERGFSFRQDGPLDMRMDTRLQQSAAGYLNTTEEETLAHWFWLYGEERLSRPIARRIVQRRQASPFSRTAELASLVESVYFQKGLKPRQRAKQRKQQGLPSQHPATKVFQALRIVVNQELAVLEQTLEQLPQLLAPGARVALISFHSLEDRRVKQYFAEACKQEVFNPGFGSLEAPPPPSFKALTRKPWVASESEQAQNPRSRSAKLRVYERL